MTRTLALDPSVAIPLLVSTHTHHEAVVRWWAGRTVVLAGHASIETYAVLTRLPGNTRVVARDAARLLEARFGAPLPLARTGPELYEELAALEIAGGAVYDAIIGIAARDADAVLATRDARARSTYERVGASIDVVLDAPA